jgi:hypothetical protein
MNSAKDKYSERINLFAGILRRQGAPWPEGVVQKSAIAENK